MADQRLTLAAVAYAAKQDRLRDSVGGFYDGANGKPIAEPVLDRISLPDGSVAVITRNRYGAECLNVADVMILDIDAPPVPLAPVWTVLGDLLGWATVMTVLLTSPANAGPLQVTGRVALALALGAIVHVVQGAALKSRIRAPDLRRTDDRSKADDTVLAALAAHGLAHPNDRFEVFRTRRGHRLILCSARATPADLDRMGALSVDPIYADMCRRQGGFRARLTPKPWNIGLPAMPRHRVSRPDENATERAAWLQSYATASDHHEVCHLMRDGASTDATIDAVLSLHARTRVGSKGLA